MAKMCPYRKITSVTSIDGGLLKCTICTKKWPKTGGDCPKGVNPETCEIIIPKRKNKVRRVKAWAWINDNGLFCAYKLLPNKMTEPFPVPKKHGYIPCIIEYKEAPNAR